MKKKITVVAIVVAIIAIAAVGGTLAYFTDTDSATNAFTAGNVKIDLTEAAVVEDEAGNLVADGDKRVDVGENEEDVYDYGKLYPGQTVAKDPTIEVTGSEDAYIAAIVTVTDGAGDIEKVIGTGYKGLLGINAIVKGGYVQENATMLSDYNGLTAGGLPVYGDDTYAIYQTAEDGTYKFYFFVEAPQAKGSKITIFEELAIPAEWGNDEMAEFVELNVTVDAYAVQEHGFESCFEAMTTAFAEDFAF